MKRIQAYAVSSDGRGNVFEDPTLFVAGRSGFEFMPLYLDEMIEVPEGFGIFELPGRATLGYNKQGELLTSTQGIGAAVFNPPAYTQLHLAAYKTFDIAPVLPLFAYSPIGWYKNKFYTSATRIDYDMRQDVVNFNQRKIKSQAKLILKKYPNNRLVNHLVQNCALTYFCPAAQNFVMGRWEAPIPISRVCNARCLGCISLQPKDKSPISCTQPRIAFTPTVNEIVEYTSWHLEHAERAVVSFGQGCEGEPLIDWELIRDSIIEIRKKTSKGIINLNTNGSLTDAVDNICSAGLDSIRISMNSIRKIPYESYYRPVNYTFEDVIETARVVRKHNRWISINYFVMPGVTDVPEEVEALRALINEVKINLIQWRNFNIDPEWFFKETGVRSLPSGIGIKKLMTELRSEFPNLVYGYFNPPIEIISKYLKI